MTALTIGVLGPLEVIVAGERVSISGPRQRALLALLALNANRVVSAASLVDAIWGDAASDRAEHTLQQHVSALRKLLGPSAITTRSPGYALDVSVLDADLFEEAARRGFGAAAASQWADAVTAFDAALECWRGPALADVSDAPVLSSAAARLDEQRLAVQEMRVEANLELGDARAMVPALEQMVADHPLRERLHGLLMLALYRSGRQADALNAYQSCRRVLVDELGIEPSKELRDLEQAILEQRSTLQPDPAAHVAELYATFRAETPRADARVTLPDGQTILLPAGVALIGREPAALVRLVDSRVSRRHAEIETVDGVSTLRDLGSTNGTTVNGAAVVEHVLQDDDAIGVGGGVELRYRTGQ